MTLKNGLHELSFTYCASCHMRSPNVRGDSSDAQHDLRKLGWRPEREAREQVYDDDHDYLNRSYFITVWYCPDCEQKRPSLKKNGGQMRVHQQKRTVDW